MGDWLDLGLLALMGVILANLFLCKVVFPTSDWDTIMHYDQYFTEVIRRHDLYPNNVWYHYFYSKGAGAFLLGILLSDQDGHKLVTFVSVVFASMSLASLLGPCRSRTVTLACIAAYLGIYVSTPWYIFDKQHVMMSCLLLGLLWASVRYAGEAGRGGRTRQR